MDRDAFTRIPLDTTEQQDELIAAIRPRTARIEFVFRDGAQEEVASELEAFDPVRTVGIGERPGWGRRYPTATVLTCAYHRDVFALIRRLGGFFTVSQPGHRVHLSGLGLTDVGCFDRTGMLFFATVTHEGLAFLRGASGVPVGRRRGAS